MSVRKRNKLLRHYSVNGLNLYQVTLQGSTWPVVDQPTDTTWLWPKNKQTNKHTNRNKIRSISFTKAQHKVNNYILVTPVFVGVRLPDDE